MNMSPIETELYEALQKSAEYNLDGLSPDESIAKAAEEMNLNPEKTCRVVEMFNIAKTHSFMQNANDKTASFPMADRESVLRAVFVEGRTPMDKEAQADEPNWTEAYCRAPESCEKVAGEVDVFTPEPIRYTSLSSLVPHLVGEIALMSEKVASLRMDCEVLKREGFNNFRYLVDYFNSSNNDGAFSEFEKQALSEDASTPVVSALNAIYNNCNLSCPRQDLSKVAQYIAFDRNDPIHLRFREMIQKCAEWNKACEDISQAEVELDLATRTKEEIFSKLSGYDLTSSRSSNKKSAVDLMGGPLLSAFEGAVPYAGAIQGVTKADSDVSSRAREHHYRALHGNQGEVDSEMEGARRAAILHDIMTKDEIVSKYDPVKVRNAYNSLQMISPSATLMPEVLRAVLRNSASQQAMDPFAAKQIADLEHAVKENHAAPAKEEKKK